MTNSSGALVPGASRKEALDQYLHFYSSTWAGRNRKVCKEAQVTDRARRVLVETEAEHRFTLLPFYPSLMEMMDSGSSCVQILLRLIQATEILEMFCTNLLLFPWKKEFRTLKKFTGTFVYYIRPALPNQTTQNILRHIGYDSENESEYRLSESVDMNVAKQMGFELFLARLECEHLLELVHHRTDAECLEIVRKRAALLTEDGPRHAANCTGAGVLEEDGQHRDNLPPSPDPSPIQSLKPEVLDVKEPLKNTDEGRQQHGIMCEDNSIMEMQESYPDLTFRQKPVFQNANMKRVKDRRKDVPTNTLSSDMSGPQGITLHVEDNFTDKKLQTPEYTAEQTQPALLHTGAMRDKLAFKNNKDPLTDLIEEMDRLRLKEPDSKEALKFPVEETVQAQTLLRKNEPIVCNLSQESVCNISDCTSCPVSSRLGQSAGITEPPRSFYIPDCLNCRSDLAPPVEHDENGRTHKPEEDLDQTYTGI